MHKIKNKIQEIYKLIILITVKENEKCLLFNISLISLVIFKKLTLQKLILLQILNNGS